MPVYIFETKPQRPKELDNILEIIQEYENMLRRDKEERPSPVFVAGLPGGDASASP